MFSWGVAHPVSFSDWVGPTVHCRPTLILPKYRVRASKKSQAAWTVRYELGTTLWRKSWGTAAGFYESVHNSKSLSKLGCCVIYRCSHQFRVCARESSLGEAEAAKNSISLARHILESHFPQCALSPSNLLENSNKEVKNLFFFSPIPTITHLY